MAQSRGPAPWVALVLLALASTALAGLQWMELIEVNRGGEAFCTIDSKIDCKTVWNLPFAKAIQSATGLPLAGWGLIWGLQALASAIAGLVSGGRDRPHRFAPWSLRLVGTVGSAACVVFLAVSVSAGVLCLTCLGTYALVWTFTGLAWWVPASPMPAAIPGALFPPALSLVVGYLMVVFVLPPIPEPRQNPFDLPSVEAPPIDSGRTTKEPAPKAGSPLEAFLADLPPPAKSALAESLQGFREGQVPSMVADYFEGASKAPVHVVDFVDVGCIHCKNLHATLAQLDQSFGPKDFTRETRFFPLDGACNAEVGRSSEDPLSARCFGAKAIICGEGREGVAAFETSVFEAQSQLGVPVIVRLAERHMGLKEAELRGCVESKATQERLKADVRFASAYGIQGTPLVVVNGKEGVPLAPFLYALILADGDADHPAFRAAGL
ncbi:MAG: vitamin K epoxide reductase family protein [Myxococcota bacterium]